MDILDILTLWYSFEVTASAEPITTLYLSIPASRDAIRVFAKRDQNIVTAHRESNEVDV